MKKKKVKKAKKTASKTISKNSFGITPMGDRVVVKPVTPETTTPSGIIIPDTAKEKPEQGIVVAVGPGKHGDDNTVIPVGVSVGDKIMFNKYGFDEVKVGGQTYYIVSEQNILAVIN